MDTQGATDSLSESRRGAQVADGEDQPPENIQVDVHIDDGPGKGVEVAHAVPRIGSATTATSVIVHESTTLSHSSSWLAGEGSTDSEAGK
jgi:hypothetical protein